MSAHSASQRRGVLAGLVAQLSAYILEPVDETVQSQEGALEPYPVVAIVSAAPRCGASTVARVLGAELALRADGAAVVGCGAAVPRRGAPPSRAASRVAAALRGAVDAVRPCGRLCLAAEADPGRLAAAARYLAPVVFDLAPDGSAPVAARGADAVAVVAAATDEPALAAAVARVLGGRPVTVVNRIGDGGAWEGRADVLVPDARVAARAALLGSRALGPLGAAMAELADALGVAE